MNQAKMLEALLEVSASFEEFEKLVKCFYDTIQPPIPDFPPQDFMVYFDTEKKRPKDKQLLADEFLKKYKINN